MYAHLLFVVVGVLGWNSICGKQLLYGVSSMSFSMAARKRELIEPYRGDKRDCGDRRPAGQ